MEWGEKKKAKIVVLCNTEKTTLHESNELHAWVEEHHKEYSEWHKMWSLTLYASLSVIHALQSQKPVHLRIFTYTLIFMQTISHL